MRSQIAVQLRPNNQITLTLGSWKKKTILPYSHINDYRLNPNYSYDLVREKADSDSEKHFHQREMARIAKKIRPLDITKKSQDSKKAPSMRLNKPKSFTRFSGQRVRESGAAMDIASNGNMRFCHEVTLTLPANTVEAFTALAAHSSYVVNRLFQYVRDNYGEDCLWFFVWEYQKRGALHMHIALYHPDESEGLYICHQLILLWDKILNDLSIEANTDMFAPSKGKRKKLFFQHQHHTAPLKKSVGAYFSKYAGKQESKTNWYVQKYPVSRFWGSSRSLKRIVKENSLTFNFDYQGNEEEAKEKYTRIIENIIEKLCIVKCSSYEFSVSAKDKANMGFYPNKRKILSIAKGKMFAEGERTTFYFTQEEFKKAMELIEIECQYF